MNRSIRSTSFSRHALSVIAAMAMVACTAGKGQEIPLGSVAPMDSARAIAEAHGLIGPEAKAALDRGNAEFTKKNYAAAMVEYRAAAAIAPQHEAPLYGIYMVARATKNTVLADSALAGMRARSGGDKGDPHAGVIPKSGGDPHAAIMPKARTKIGG